MAENLRPTDDPTRTAHDARLSEALEQIRTSLRGLQFGVLSVIVQNGVVVQIDRLEKRRLVPS